MTNPYNAPNANVAHNPSNDSYEPKLFALNGRIGRMRYLAYGLAYAAISYLAMIIIGLATGIGGVASGMDPTAMGAGFLIGIFVLYIPMLILFAILMRRRINDLDKSGWWMLLFLVPIANIIFGLYILFARGSEGSNRWGPKPTANSTGVIVAGSIYIGLIVIGIVAAIALPALMFSGAMSEDSAYEQEYDSEDYSEEASSDEGYSEEAYDEESYSEDSSYEGESTMDSGMEESTEDYSSENAEEEATPEEE